MYSLRDKKEMFQLWFHLNSKWRHEFKHRHLDFSWERPNISWERPNIALLFSSKILAD